MPMEPRQIFLMFFDALVSCGAVIKMVGVFFVFCVLCMSMLTSTLWGVDPYQFGVVVQSSWPHGLKSVKTKSS